MTDEKRCYWLYLEDTHDNRQNQEQLSSSLSELAECNPSTLRSFQGKQIYCSAVVISEASRWTATCPKLTTNNSKALPTGWFPWLREVKHYFTLLRGPEATCDQPVKELTAVSSRAGKHKQRHVLPTYRLASPSHACFIDKSRLLYKMLS